MGEQYKRLTYDCITIKDVGTQLLLNMAPNKNVEFNKVLALLRSSLVR